jgi:hypothetical protein
MAHTFQDRVLAELSTAYRDSVQSVLIHLQPPQLPAEVEHENTARSRSLLFLTLGVVSANLLTEDTAVCVPENGLISLNVPMTATRAGSLSTRTTHVYFLGLFQEAMAGLGLRHVLRTPYRFRTKGEMLREAANPELMKRLTPLTMSCAHPENVRWAGGTPGTHCGHCLPCLVRRAAVAAAGYPDAIYDCNVLTHPPAADSERGRDYRALSMAFERLRAATTHRFMFEVLNAGPLPPELIGEFAGVFSRGLGELRVFFQGGSRNGSRARRASG